MHYVIMTAPNGTSTEYWVAAKDAARIKRALDEATLNAAVVSYRQRFEQT